MLEILLFLAATVLVERLCSWEDEPKGLWIPLHFGAGVLCVVLAVPLWFGILGLLAAFGLRILLRRPRKGRVTR